MRRSVRHLLALLAAAAAAAVAMPAAAGAETQAGGATAARHDDDSFGGNYYEDDGSSDYYDDGGSSEYDDYEDVSDPSSTGGQQPSGTTRAPAAPAQPVTPVIPITPTIPTGPPVAYVSGKVAQLQSNGKAAIPRGAPESVRRMISAGNRLIGKPYKWGGGHAKLEDKGYDCSGSVSYALIGGSALVSPMVSGGLAKWGAAGPGRWVTVYANAGHVYMEVAGLRLDTSPIGDASQNKGPRWRPVIGKRSGFKVRHPVGL